MTVPDKVYTKVKKMMKLDHQEQVLTLKIMITDFVPSRKARLSAIGSEIPTETKKLKRSMWDAWALGQTLAHKELVGKENWISRSSTNL